MSVGIELPATIPASPASGIAVRVQQADQTEESG
jgi:hypothetical protein